MPYTWRNIYAVDGTVWRWRSAEIADAAIYLEFKKWRVLFEATPDNKPLMSRIRTLSNLHPALAGRFEERFLFACFCAAKHDPEASPRAVRARERAALARAIKKQRRAVAEIKKFAVPNRLRVMNALRRAGVPLPHDVGAFASMMSVYDAALQNLRDGPPSSGGAQGDRVSRSTIACLSYGKAVPDRNVPSYLRELGLAFELLMLIRHFNSSTPEAALSDLMRTGMPRHPLPAKGPIYPLIADLLCVVVPRPKKQRATGAKRLAQPTGESVRKEVDRFVSDYEKSTFIGWPIPSVRPPT